MFSVKSRRKDGSSFFFRCIFFSVFDWRHINSREKTAVCPLLWGLLKEDIVATPDEISHNIEKIRRKPVSQMTGKELAYIYKNGQATVEEKKTLKVRIEQAKAKKSSSMANASMRNTSTPSAKKASVEKMISTRKSAPVPSLNKHNVSFDDDMFSVPVPASVPTALDISAADAGVYENDAMKTNKTVLARLRRGLTQMLHEPVLIIAIVGMLFMLLFFRAFFVPSGSMRPTLLEGDRIVSIAQYFPSGTTYQRGDIACFNAPNGTVYVKRVIGIGGDHIQISGEKVYVNGEESPYQGTGGVMTSMDVQLADDEYWMMGDNRGNSEDSRFIGPVKADKMISKVIAIYQPADRAKLI